MINIGHSITWLGTVLVNFQGPIQEIKNESVLRKAASAGNLQNASETHKGDKFNKTWT